MEKRWGLGLGDVAREWDTLIFSDCEAVSGLWDLQTPEVAEVNPMSQNIAVHCLLGHLSLRIFSEPSRTHTTWFPTESLRDSTANPKLRGSESAANPYS